VIRFRIENSRVLAGGMVPDSAPSPHHTLLAPFKPEIWEERATPTGRREKFGARIRQRPKPYQ